MPIWAQWFELDPSLSNNDLVVWSLTGGRCPYNLPPTTTHMHQVCLSLERQREELQRQVAAMDSQLAITRARLEDAGSEAAVATRTDGFQSAPMAAAST